MGRHVIRTLQGVFVLWPILGNEPIEDGFHIYTDIRIGILIDAQSATGMLAEYIDQARLWQRGQLAQDLACH
jgi:hypothetical protein